MKNLVKLRGEPTSLLIDSIVEPDFQLRINYSEETLDALGNSMGEEGMFYPLLVWNHGADNYELIAGSRRLRAAKLKGYTEIPAYIVDAESPAHALRLALSENLQREDLDPFEEARGFLRLVFEYKMSQKEVAKSLNKTEAFIRNRLALLALPEAVQEKVATGELGLQFVRSLIQLRTGEEQVHYASLVVQNRLTQAELNALISKRSEEGARVSVRGLTVEKIVARVTLQKQWFSKIPRRSRFKLMTSDERLRVADELLALEQVIRSLRKGLIDEAGVQQRLRMRGDDHPSSHGETWTIRELKKITAEDRPSDEDLAMQLNRTPAAIASARSKYKSR